MEIKKLAIGIGIVDAVLLVVCLFLYLGKDRTPPVISFGDSTAVYEDGMDESLLLQEVTATDDRDGDVSNSLMVEKVAGTNGKEVIVTFVALDQSNNVGKASKVFAVASGSAAAPDGEDMLADDGNRMSQNETESGTAMGVDSAEDNSSEDGGAADNRDAKDTQQDGNAGDENGGKENTGDENREDGDGNEEQSGPAPVLVMNSDEIITKKGTAPNWNTVIDTMSDDKDDYNTLYNNLKLEGQVKLNEEGEYPVTLYTVDTDGNRSEVRNLVVRVS